MDVSNYSRKISKIINTFLKEDAWKYIFDDNSGIFRFSLNLHGRIKSISYYIVIKEDGYIVYAVSPIGVDKNDLNSMTRMAEFICRANYGLKNGNFEMDFRDGELRYKVFVDCTGINPSNDIIKTSIYSPALMFERYGGGITDVIFSDISVESSINKCENSQEDEIRPLLVTPTSSNGEVGEILEKLAAHFSPDNADSDEWEE